MHIYSTCICVLYSCTHRLEHLKFLQTLTGHGPQQSIAFRFYLKTMTINIKKYIILSTHIIPHDSEHAREKIIIMICYKYVVLHSLYNNTNTNTQIMRSLVNYLLNYLQ